MTKKMVSEVMSTGVATVSADKHIYDVAVKMKDQETGFIPIVETESSYKLVGVVTDRDLVLRGYAGKHSGSTGVEEVMTKKVHTVTKDTTADEAAELMAKYQIRRVPVIEGDQLIGIVSLGDLAVTHLLADNAGEALTQISEHLH